MTIDAALKVIATATGFVAAILAGLDASALVPNNIDTTVAAMNHAAHLSTWAAIFAIIGAVASAVLVFHEIK